MEISKMICEPLHGNIGKMICEALHGNIGKMTCEAWKLAVMREPLHGNQ